MLKLVRLEWKKNNIGKYIKGVIIMAALLGLFVFALAFLGIANDPDGTLDAAPGTDVISAPIELFTSMAFLIYTSVMLASFAVDFSIGSLSFYIQLILKSVVIVSMSFIALFVGMALKSSKATIVTSFLLIFLTQANIGDFTMAGNAVFPIILTAISLLFAALSIINVESKDLM